MHFLKKSFIYFLLSTSENIIQELLICSHFLISDMNLVIFFYLENQEATTAEEQKNTGNIQ
jgi:hypothetical protein